MKQLKHRDLSVLRFLLRFCLVTLVSSLTAFYAKKKLFGRKKKYPPGPWGLPVVGILPFLDAGNPASKVLELSKTYGPVFGGYLGGLYTVFLNDYDIIMEAFGRKNDVMSDRPQILPFIHYSRGQGVAGSFYHNNWKENRKFVMTSLNKFGVGKPVGHIADILETEIDYFLRDIDRRGKEHDIGGMVMMFSGNVMLQFMLGIRFDYSDTETQSYLDKLAELFALADPANPCVLFDFLRHLPYTSNRRFIGYCDEIMSEFTEVQLQKKLDALQMNRNSGLVDYYVSKFGDKETGELSPAHSKNLQHLVNDLLAAGTDTTTANTLWLLLCVIKYPEVQRNIQAEIDSVVGTARPPRLADRERLPYTEAVGCESRRYCLAGPFSVPHSATTDTDIHGYFVPKGSMVIANAWAVSRNPELFPDPEQFKPERFLTKDGKLKLDEKVLGVTFGFGRRTCAGRHLATAEMFLILTNLLYEYNLKIEGGPDSVKLVPERGLATRPHPYKIIFEPRNNSL
ncbi:Cytochrome P450 1A1 [Holothuria leucospilota]|uniref:Cytochrome P450 1A1 n=1 Tax=Holothuria leucospilota TaxID=206669 RepID=A0A9Q1CAG0_HOLLE|nr:Cytochrome P450 1A1 [Holothuria leucospilota]